MSNEIPPFDILAFRVEYGFDARFAAQLAARVAALAQPPTTADLQALRALFRDLRAIHAGSGPDPKLLASAPLLTGWRLVLAPDGLRLTGDVAGHPKLGQRKGIVTSPVFALDPRAWAWARTWSRYYRLGSPCAAPSPKRSGVLLN